MSRWIYTKVEKSRVEWIPQGKTWIIFSSFFSFQLQSRLSYRCGLRIWHLGDGTQGKASAVEGDYSQVSHNSLLDLGWEMGESWLLLRVRSCINFCKENQWNELFYFVVAMRWDVTVLFCDNCYDRKSKFLCLITVSPSQADINLRAGWLRPIKPQPPETKVRLHNKL